MGKYFVTEVFVKTSSLIDELQGNGKIWLKCTEVFAKSSFVLSRLITINVGLTGVWLHE